jgi:hypothetical protein
MAAATGNVKRALQALVCGSKEGAAADQEQEQPPSKIRRVEG